MKKQKGFIKSIFLMAITAAMAVGCTATAFASSLTDPVDSVKLNIKYDLEEDMTKSDVTLTCNTDGVTAAVTSISNTDDGDEPTVKITLKADTSDGYYFDSDDSSAWKTSSLFSFSGYKVTYKSSSRSSTSIVYLYVTLPEIGSSAASYKTESGQQTGLQSSGWIQNGDNSWSFMKDANTKQKGWVEWSGKWYFLNDQGIMQTGWVMDNGKYYYLGTDGAMYENRKTPDGYSVGTDGAWQKQN